LIKDPTKKFTYAEMAFFMRWWREQDNQMKYEVKKLVSEGRLEFVNGGWSMNDEATTHYEDIITNMQKGHRFLLEEFAVTPNVAWHIDPFGHSNAQAALFSRMGFDSWYICRIDYRDKIERRDSGRMEFVWMPFFLDRGNDDSIFTHVTYDMYWGIPNFYFGDSRAEEPLVPGYNLDERLDEFASWALIFNETYKTNHVFIPMGGDFNYQNAHTIFMNLDRIIKYFNGRYSGMEVHYSTPGEYMKAVMEKGKASWDTNINDFFPYADDQESYWTGFFSSRPNQKGYIRQCSNQLMAANQFLAMEAIRKTTSEENLALQEKLEDAVSIAQHHDAATGTSKKAVADDYLDYLYTGIKASEEAELNALKKLYGTDVDWTFCDVTNGTYQ
jgi:lysosomal alpha-mannosidase